jgi:tagatose-1,6-bisphosphate aldolase
VQLSLGKHKRLESVSDPCGIIGALATDQRDALRSLFSVELKIEKIFVLRGQLEEFKSIVVRALSRYATAVLREPECGLRAAPSALRPHAGLYTSGAGGTATFRDRQHRETFLRHCKNA